MINAPTFKVAAWTWTVWPTWATPTEPQLVALANQKGLRAVDDYHRQRELNIQREAHDPLQYGWEQPPVALVRALLAGTYQPPFLRSGPPTTIRSRSLAPVDWRQNQPANDVVLLGGNGSAKSYIQAKFGVALLLDRPKTEWRAFSQNEQTSIRYIQAPAFTFLPPALRGIKSKGITTKISYKEATGFSEGCFILPTSSAAFFPTYKSWEQDRKSVEGGEADVATWDEEIPAELLRTLRFRVHKKGGYVLGGFTPIGGYTETVAEYLDAGVVLECIPAREVVWDWNGRTWDWGRWLLPPEQELVKGCPRGHLPLVIQSGGGAGRRFAVTMPTLFNPYTNVAAILDSTAAGEYVRKN